MKATWLGVVMVLLAGCGGERTVADICGSLGEASCKRWKSCDATAPALGDCKTVFVRDCCAQASCGSAPAATQASVTVCTQDIAVSDCSTLMTDLPTSCNGVAAAAPKGGSTTVHGDDNTSGPTTGTTGTGTIALSWYVTDFDDTPLTCAQAGASTIRLTATGAGSPVTKTLTCDAALTTWPLPAGSYTLDAALLDGSGSTVSAPASGSFDVTANMTSHLSLHLSLP